MKKINIWIILWYVFVALAALYIAQLSVKADTYTETIKVYMGNTKKLTIYTDETVTWKSSKTSIATVNSKGRITPKSYGKTIITATTNEDTYEYIVYVCAKYTEDEVKELLSGDLTGTVKEISKSIFYSNPQKKVSQLKDIQIGDYLKINGTLYIVVNRTSYRLAVYDGKKKFNISYNRARAQSKVIIYTRY